MSSPNEAQAIVEFLKNAHPSWRPKPDTAAAWAVTLADVPHAAVERAAVDLSREVGEPTIGRLYELACRRPKAATEFPPIAESPTRPKQAQSWHVAHGAKPKPADFDAFLRQFDPKRYAQQDGEK